MAGIEGLLAGHTLGGRYRIEEVIGRGGYAAVYRARDERLRRTVAVKIVMLSAPDEEARERIRARFHREARAAAQLQHPNVVSTYDFGTDETLSLDYLVMELLHGEDLAARVARTGPPSMDLSLRILREAADGVAAGHRAGLIHRDVKPGNIFLEERSGMDVFRVCVLDFGIAQIVAGEETVTALTRGRTPLSPAYASPEHLRDERPLTPAADVYGLGVIGYELLTGERLFKGDLSEQERREIPSVRSVNPEVPEGVARVIDRALSHAPGDRYADAAAMTQALSEAEGEYERPLVTPAPPLPTPGMALPDQDAEPSALRKYRARRRPRLPEEEASSVAPAIAHSTRRSILPLLLVTLAAALLVGWWIWGRGDREDTRPTALGGGGSGSAAEADDGGSLPGPADAEIGVGATGGASNPAAEAGGFTTPVEDVSTPAVSGQTPPPSPGASAERPPSGASAAALHAEGLRLFQAGDVDGAVERLRRAVAAAPRNASYRNDFGWALFTAGELGAAGRELEEVIRLEPSRDIAYANLGEVHLARGDTAEAIRFYERFLSLNTHPARERIAERKLARIRG